MSTSMALKCIFLEGNGEKTLVFMAGSGTGCPTLDFKPLWSLLTKRHRIVVIEKVTQLGEVTLTGHDSTRHDGSRPHDRLPLLVEVNGQESIVIWRIFKSIIIRRQYFENYW